MSRPLGGSNYMLVGTSPAQAIVANTGVSTYVLSTPPLGSTITIAGLPIQGTLNIAATVTTGQCGAGLTAHYVSGLTTSGVGEGKRCTPSGTLPS